MSQTLPCFWKAQDLLSWKVKKNLQLSKSGYEKSAACVHGIWDMQGAKVNLFRPTWYTSALPDNCASRKIHRSFMESQVTFTKLQYWYNFLYGVGSFSALWMSRVAHITLWSYISKWGRKELQVLTTFTVVSNLWRPEYNRFGALYYLRSVLSSHS